MEMLWLDATHVRNGTIDGAMEQARELYWNLKVIEGEKEWFVYAGEDLLLIAESPDQVNAFIYGFGLAYGCLPHEVFSQLKKQVKALVDPDDPLAN